MSEYSVCKRATLALPIGHAQWETRVHLFWGGKKNIGPTWPGITALNESQQWPPMTATNMSRGSCSIHLNSSPSVAVPCAPDKGIRPLMEPTWDCQVPESSFRVVSDVDEDVCFILCLGPESSATYIQVTPEKSQQFEPAGLRANQWNTSNNIRAQTVHANG